VNLEALDASILAAPLAAGLLVLATHVPLGREVLSRGIIFIDLAIAQIAALGVLVAAWLGLGGHALEGEAWLVQLVAAASALTGAALLRWTERRWPAEQEAIIGVTFILAATLAILVLARDPHGGEHLRELLAGQVLWVGWGDLVPVAMLYALVLIAWFAPWARTSRMKFYLLFALAVTASVQLVGIYLVFASLIIPALVIRRLGGAGALVLGYLLGSAGYVLGLAGSALFDLPSGPSIVWALALMSGAYAAGRRLVRRSDR
jgi:zinc/manganese transport system permease protein